MAFHTAQSLGVGNVKQWLSSYGTQWIGITDTGYVVSTDDESTWSKKLLQSTAHATLAEKDGRIYAFVGNKVMYSDDRKTWVDGMTADTTGDTSLSFINDRFVYMVQSDTRKLYRSYDGLNPTEVFDLPPSINGIASSDKGVLIAITSTGGNAYRSVDNGETWIPIGLPLTGLSTSNEMSTIAFINDRFFIGFKEHSRIFVSTNELGTVFEPANVLENNATNPRFFAFVEYDNHVVALGENEVYAFDRNDWKKVSAPTLKPVYAQASGQVFIASSTNGKMIFSNNLSTWQVLDSGTTRQITAIAANYNRTAMIGQSSGYVQKYTIDVAPHENISIPTAEVTIHSTTGIDVIARQGELDSFHFMSGSGGHIVKLYRTGTLLAKTSQAPPQPGYQYPRYRVDRTVIASEPAMYPWNTDAKNGKLTILNDKLEPIETVVPYEQHIIHMDVDRNGNLYVYYDDSHLIKYNRSLEEQWRKKLPFNNVCEKMKFDVSGRLYIKAYMHIACIDPGKGDMLWQVSTGSIENTWALDETTGVLVTRIGKASPTYYYCIEPTGKVRWSYYRMLGNNIVNSFVIDRNGRLFIHEEQGFLGMSQRMSMYFFEHDMETGEVLSQKSYVAGYLDGYDDLFVDHENRLYGYRRGSSFHELDWATFRPNAPTIASHVNGTIGREASVTPRQVDRVDAIIYTDVMARLQSPQIKYK